MNRPDFEQARTFELPEGSDRNASAVRQWVAFWDADSQHVAITGEHLGDVMWSDDRAVGVRGWYY